jgi:hypothetical protein
MKYNQNHYNPFLAYSNAVMFKSFWPRSVHQQEEEDCYQLARLYESFD